ncbi:MAG: universal stress protein [Burkholderiales bacterium]
MHTFLVAFDGSAHAFRAIEKTLTLMDAKQMHIRLLNVQEPVRTNETLFKDTGAGMQEILREREHAGMEALKPAKAMLERAGVKHALHVETGEPGEVIPAFARSHHCEMIVMGTRGMGKIQGLMLGSVASKVLHLSEVPVLVVK